MCSSTTLRSYYPNYLFPKTNVLKSPVESQANNIILVVSPPLSRGWKRWWMSPVRPEVGLSKVTRNHAETKLSSSRAICNVSNHHSTGTASCRGVCSPTGNLFEDISCASAVSVHNFVQSVRGFSQSPMSLRSCGSKISTIWHAGIYKL